MTGVAFGWKKVLCNFELNKAATKSYYERKKKIKPLPSKAKLVIGKSVMYKHE